MRCDICDDPIEECNLCLKGWHHRTIDDYRLHWATPKTTDEDLPLSMLKEES